jgi:hypothetical protein
MKCKYKYCKNNNEVIKENAIKIGNSYYCKQCYKEKNDKGKIEKLIIEKLPTAVITIVRKVINQLIYDKGYDSEYVLFVVSKILKDNMVLNNPFGIISYCTNNHLYKEWQTTIINEKFLDFKTTMKNTNNDSEKVVFNITQSKKWTDII